MAQKSRAFVNRFGLGFLVWFDIFWAVLDQLGLVLKVFGSSESIFEILMARLDFFKRVCGLFTPV